MVDIGRVESAGAADPKFTDLAGCAQLFLQLHRVSPASFGVVCFMSGYMDHCIEVQVRHL